MIEQMANHVLSLYIWCQKPQKSQPFLRYFLQHIVFFFLRMVPLPMLFYLSDITVLYHRQYLGVSKTSYIFTDSQKWPTKAMCPFGLFEERFPDIHFLSTVGIRIHRGKIHSSFSFMMLKPGPCGRQHQLQLLAQDRQMLGSLNHIKSSFLLQLSSRSKQCLCCLL